MDTIFIRPFRFFLLWQIISLGTCCRKKATRELSTLAIWFPRFYDSPMARMFSIILFFPARISSFSTLPSSHSHTHIYADTYIHRHTHTLWLDEPVKPRYKVYKITSPSKLPVTDYMVGHSLDLKILPARAHIHIHVIFLLRAAIRYFYLLFMQQLVERDYESYLNIAI